MFSPSSNAIKRKHGGDEVSTTKRHEGGAENDEMYEGVAALERGTTLTLTSFRRVCDLFLVHRRSTKDADIVQRACGMMAELFEQAGIAIEGLVTECEADSLVGVQLVNAFDYAAFPDEISLLPATDLVDVFRDAMSHLVYTGQWMMAAGKCTLFSPGVAPVITSPAPMHVLS